MPVRLNSLHPEVLSRLIGLPREQFHVAKPAAQNFQFLSKSLETHRLHTTILSALQEVKAVGGYADIIVWPGQYKESATIDITNDSTRLLTAEMGPMRAKTRTEIRQHGNVDTPMISVEGAHNVEIAGFRLTPYSSASGRSINAGLVSAPYGLYIHDNYFYCATSTPVHLVLGTDASFDCDSVYIANNDFYLGGGAGLGIIEWNAATRAQIVGNSFWMHGNTSDYMGINIYDAAAFRGGILDNRFTCIEVGLTGSSAVAINNPTAVGGDGIIDGNRFVNFGGDANCIASRLNQTLGVNYNNEAIIASGS